MATYSKTGGNCLAKILRIFLTWKLGCTKKNKMDGMYIHTCMMQSSRRDGE